MLRVTIEHSSDIPQPLGQLSDYGIIVACSKLRSQGYRSLAQHVDPLGYDLLLPRQLCEQSVSDATLNMDLRTRIWSGELWLT